MNLNLYKIPILIFCLSAAQIIRAQELPSLAYFMNNRLLYNPAAAGTNETQFTASLVSRFQWAGVAGAPTTALFWTDYKFVPQNMAAAISVFQDRVGGYVNTDVLAHYSYQVYLTKKLKLSLGLSAGVGSVSFGNVDMLQWDDNDATYQKALTSSTVPKFGFGAQLYASNFFASLSAPDILVIGDLRGYQRLSEGSFFQKKRNYVAMAGYNFKLSDKYVLTPNLLFLYHPLSGFKIDANLQLKLLDYFWIGGTFSTSGNHNLMAGTQLSSRMKFGYSYGFRSSNSTTPLLSSHEVNLILFLDRLFQPREN